MKYLILFVLLALPLPLAAQQQTDITTLPINVNGHYTLLNWSESAVVDGYNIYRGTQSGGPYTKINSALVTSQNYTDHAVQAGFTYDYVVTAVRGGSESGYSNQASATIPSP